MLLSKKSRGALLGLAATFALASCSDDPPDLTHGESYPAVFMDVSSPLRDMVKIAPAVDTELIRGWEAEPARTIRARGSAGQVDPVVQNHQGTAPIATTLANFEGNGAGLAGFTVQSAPPDTDGDIGPNHYVQIVNQAFTIFNRQGTPVMGPSNSSSLWQGFAGACSQTNDGDATVRYDRIADRWVIAQFSVNGGSGPFKVSGLQTRIRPAPTRATRSLTAPSTTTRRWACGPTRTTSRSTCSRTSSSRAARSARWIARRC
jgi:hypothetical protein